MTTHWRIIGLERPVVSGFWDERKACGALDLLMASIVHIARIKLSRTRLADSRILDSRVYTIVTRVSCIMHVLSCTLIGSLLLIDCHCFCWDAASPLALLFDNFISSSAHPGVTRALRCEMPHCLWWLLITASVSKRKQFSLLNINSFIVFSHCVVNYAFSVR